MIPGVLDAIEAAVDAAAQGGHGSLVVLHGLAHRLADALDQPRRPLEVLSGSFDVVLSDGKKEQRFHLNRSYRGLYVAPMMWRYLDNFSSGAVCLVLASKLFEEADYIRDHTAFLEAVGSGNR